MPETVNLVDRTTGRTFGVPADQVAAYTAQGFRPESDEEGIDRTTAETFHEEHGGLGGALTAGVVGGLSGLTLGGSDLALGALGAGRTLKHLEAEHPYATGAGTIAGALAPTILTGGAAAGEETAGLGARILANTPAGLAGRAGGAIGGLGEGAGLVGRTVAGTAGAAAEGALYGGGQYLTETALEDKPLSAEGFVAGMGHGALFAAPIGAAGTLASATLQRARALFPRSEVSAAAAAGVKEQASGALAQTVRDGDVMVQAAQRKLSDIDAGVGMAQAGETTTRRVFGEAHPQALADQVTGATARQEVSQALEGYQQARAQFEDWIATEADPEFAAAMGKLEANQPALDRMLAGADQSDLETMLGTMRGHAPGNPQLEGAMRRLVETPDVVGAGGIPVGEFGAPGKGGFKGQDTLARLAADTGTEDGAQAASLAAADATGAGGPRALRVQGTPAGGVPAQDIVQQGMGERPAAAAPSASAAPTPIERATPAAGPAPRRFEVTFSDGRPHVHAPGEPARSVSIDEMRKLADEQMPAGFQRQGLMMDDDLRIDHGQLPESIHDVHFNSIAVVSPRQLASHVVRSEPVSRAAIDEVIGTWRRGGTVPTPWATMTPDLVIHVERGGAAVLAAAEEGRQLAIKVNKGLEHIPSSTGVDITERIAPGARPRAASEAGHAAAPAQEIAPRAPTDPATGPLEIRRVGDRRNATFEAKLPDGSTRTLADRGEVTDLVNSQLPSGFQHGPLLETHRDLAIERGLPRDQAAIRDNALYVARPSELADHGIMGNDIHPEHAAKMAEARASGVALEPIEIKMTPDGKYWLEEGNHRLNEAAKSDAPVAIKFKPVSEKFERQRGTYEIGDRLRGMLPRAADSAGDDLLSALSATKSALGHGESMAAIGRPAAAATRAEQGARAGAAAEHFRAQALGARAERARIGAPDAPWNEGFGPTPGGYEGSRMAAEERSALAEHHAGVAERSRSAAPPEPTASSDPLAAFGLESDPTRAGAAVGEVPADVRAMALPERTAVDKSIRGRMGAVHEERQIAKAIMRHNGKNVDMGPSLARGAKVIGDMEQSSARLADALGSEAPPTAVTNAKAFHAATGQAQERAAASSAKLGADLQNKVPAMTGGSDATVVDDDVAKALRKHESRAAARADKTPASSAPETPQPAGSAAQAGAATGGIGGKAADLGSALEVMRAIGMHVPAISHIPVIGPILGLWLKARAVMGILGRKGGSIGKSTEGLIAGKAAAVQDRIVAATGALLEGGARAAGKASHLAGPAVLLEGSLFPGGGKPKGDSPRDMFEARSDDITRAMHPGAIDQAIAQRFPTSDPAMHDAIVVQVQKGIAFLDSKRPKQTVLPGVLPGDGAWKASTAAIDEFSKFVHAVNDPVSVLEDLAKGHPSAEGAETLRVVYPELYRYAQKELLAAAPEMAKTLPYPRRAMLSILYQIPVDGTMQPSHAQYLQIPAPPAAAPKAPATSGPLRLGQQTMSPLDQRASGA